MSRASTAARHRGPRAAHPTHSAALGSSVQKSCFFFRDVRNGLSLHRPIFPGGHRICPPPFCTRKRSALRTNPKAKAKRVSTVLPVSAEHDEASFIFFPLARSGLTADVTHFQSLFRSLPRPSHHHTTPAYGVARNRVPARLNSIFWKFGCKSGLPPRSSLEWAYLPAFALYSIFRFRREPPLSCCGPGAAIPRTACAKAKRFVLFCDVSVAVCLAELGSAALPYAFRCERNHAALALVRYAFC